MSEYPRVTEILRSAGLVDFSGVPESTLEASRQFGSAVHKACELYDGGILDEKSLSEPIVPCLEQWQKFRYEFSTIYHSKNDAIEMCLESKKYRFKGTPDRIIIVKGWMSVVEIKTCSSFNASMGIQLAAYQQLWNENNPKNKATKRYAVLLSADGYKVQEYKDKSDFTVFLSALNICNFKKRMGYGEQDSSPTD